MPEKIEFELRGEQTRVIQDQSIRASFQPDSLNEEARTVDLVFATETPIRKMTWDGPVMEVLSMQDGEVRLDRLNNGANLLDNHNGYGSVNNTVLGVVERAWIAKKQGWATVRFAKTDAGELAWQNVKDGILRNVSVGYKVYTYVVTRKEGKLDEYRATEWEAFEVSLVSVPADAGAQIRSGEENKIITHKIEVKMAEENKTIEPQKDTPPAVPVVDVEQVRKEAVETERKRVAEIQTAVRQANLGADFAEKFIQDNTSVDDVRAAVLEELEKRQVKIQNNHDAQLKGKDEVEKRRDGMEAGLLLRSGMVGDAKQGKIALTDEQATFGRQFRSDTLLDIAKACLIRAGENIEGLDKMSIVARAITSSTSDFPVILEGTIRRILLANYEAVQDVWRQFCMVGSVSDFRENKRLRMGSFSRLDKVMENAEYKNKPIPDAEFEKISAETYGNTINVSRKMIINDDLNAFARLAQMLGRAAARSIEIDVFSLFALNSGNGPTMQDGNPLFDAAHGNIGTGSTITVAGLDADRVLMARQKDPSGNDYLDIRPSVLLVPVELGGTARVINEAVYDPDTANKLQKPNMVNGLFQNIVDTPRLSGTVRYLFANPMDEPVFEVAFLNGVESPFMETEEAFSVDGMKWKVRMDYGFGAIGWRGVVKNAGTA